MAVAVEDLVDSFVAAWGADATDRLVLLRRAFPEDAVMVGGHEVCRGVDAIAEFIGRSQEGDSPVCAERTSEIDAHGGWLRFGWRASERDGGEVLEGIDVAELADDGRIRRLVVFHPVRPRPR